MQYCVLLTLALGGVPGCGGDAKTAAGDAANPDATARMVSASRDTARQSGRRTLVFVGTSLTAGLGLDPDKAYPALIQQKADSAALALDVVNAGLSGETSAGALRRIDWLLSGPVDVLVLETGANDGLRGLNVDSTRANIRAILAKVKAARPNALLALVQMEAPPNLGDRYTAAFREMFPALAKEMGATLVPFLLDRVAGVEALNQDDGIHPNERGERIVADNVWRALAPLVNAP